MELSVEQKNRIEENKRRAMDILRRKQDAAQIDLLADKLCWNVQECKSENIEQNIFEVFGERICSVCKLKTDQYELISKGEATSTYLVTDDALTTLKFQTRDNPHHANWTPMKLYLRKHVLELSLKRFGSMEKLAEVKKERESLRYEKSLSKTVDILASSTEGLRGQLNDAPGSSGASAMLGKSESTRKQSGDSANESQKRKKSALSSLVGIIRGDSKK